MKRFFTLSLILLFTGIVSFAQVPGEKFVPDNVKAKYSKDFPDASLKRWVKMGKDYKAVMVHENKDAWVRYTKDARMRWVCHTWRGNDVPAIYTDKIEQDFPGFKANWATETDNPNLNKHQFLIRLSKPGFVLKVLMNADGTYAKESNEDLEKE